MALSLEFVCFIHSFTLFISCSFVFTSRVNVQFFLVIFFSFVFCHVLRFLPVSFLFVPVHHRIISVQLIRLRAREFLVALSLYYFMLLRCRKIYQSNNFSLLPVVLLSKSPSYSSCSSPRFTGFASVVRQVPVHTCSLTHVPAIWSEDVSIESIHPNQFGTPEMT